jgi:uncharacterized protein YecT (DUF1311 family)
MTRGETKVPARAGALALAAALLLAAPAWAQQSAWQGTWKTKDPNVLEHLLLEINGLTPEGFSVSFDEGVGSHGRRGGGAARFVGAAKASAALEYAGQRCELTLTLRGHELSASGCPLGSDGASADVVLVPASTRRIFTAGFNCARARGALPNRICSERSLADLDRSLTETYGKLRVRLNKADQHRLRGEQRDWLIRRDGECGPMKEREPQVRCLKRHYGSRLFGLRAWRDFRVHVPGDPDYAAVRAVADAAMAAGKAVPELLGMGLAAWLNGYVEASVLESDEFARYEASAGEDWVAVSGTLAPRSGPKRDPRAEGRRIVFAAHLRNGLWFGDSYPSPTVYAPANRPLADAPEAVKRWAGEFPGQTIELRNTLP